MLSRFGAAAHQISVSRVLRASLQARRVVASGHAHIVSLSNSSAPPSRRCYATATKSAKKPALKATTTTEAPAAKVGTRATAKSAVKKAVKKPVKKPAKKPAKKGLKTKAKAKTPVKRKAKKAPVKTPEEKERIKLRKEKVKAKVTLAELRVAALMESNVKTPGHVSARNMLSRELLASTRNANEKSVEHFANAQAEVKKVYDTLAPAELEKYELAAREERAAKIAAYKTWVESHTPEQIRLANNARRQLKKLGAPRTNGLAPIKDDRIPVRPKTAYLFYLATRFASGDYKDLGIVGGSKRVAAEWKSITPAEAQTYHDQALAAKQRYEQEKKTVFP